MSRITPHYSRNIYRGRTREPPLNMESHISPGLALLLLVCSAPLAAGTAVERRCTEVSEGKLEGELVALEPMLVPPLERRHTLFIPFNETCGSGGAGGVVVTACDVVSPQVEVRGAAGQEWGEMRVLRLGPTWLPLLLELTLFCDPAPTPPITTPAPTVAPTSPGRTFTLSPVTPLSGPVLVPVD